MANANVNNVPTISLTSQERDTLRHAKGFTLRLQKEGVRALRFEIISCNPTTLKCIVRGTDGTTREDIHLSRLLHDPVSAATLRQMNRATTPQLTTDDTAILQSLGMLPATK